MRIEIVDIFCLPLCEDFGTVPRVQVQLRVIHGEDSVGLELDRDSELKLLN